MMKVAATIKRFTTLKTAAIATGAFFLLKGIVWIALAWLVLR